MQCWGKNNTYNIIKGYSGSYIRCYDTLGRCWNSQESRKINEFVDLLDQLGYNGKKSQWKKVGNTGEISRIGLMAEDLDLTHSEYCSPIQNLNYTVYYTPYL